jgi:paraquat-inducible protein A
VGQATRCDVPDDTCRTSDGVAAAGLQVPMDRFVVRIARWPERIRPSGPVPSKDGPLWATSEGEPRLETIACPDCDLVQRIPELAPGAKARCARCTEVLARGYADPLGRPLALTVAALIAFILANTSPLMALSAVGRESSTTIIGGAHEMWVRGSELTAVAVAICAVVAPAIHIAFMLVVLLAVRRPPAPRWVGEMLRFAHLVEPWSMTEVMMLGILVALVKIAQLATVVPGMGIYAAGAFIALLTAVMATFDPREVWKRVEWADGTIPPVPAEPSAFRRRST